MDGETMWRVTGLSREAALHRERRAEASTHLHWPQEIRRGAVALLARDMPIGEWEGLGGTPSKVPAAPIPIFLPW
jgi:hypothetical protein